ncbi:MAG: hypothetical protein C4303_07060 [candidate division GAL15 bacterium]
MAEVFRRLLEENRVMTLATCSPEGPWAAPVLYALRPGPQLVFMSRTGTRHVRDLLASPRVAVAIYPHQTRPLRGVQLEGVARPLAGRETLAAIRAYLQRFPAARGRFPLWDAVRGRGEVRFFALRPERAYVLSEVDFGWGARREVPLHELLRSFR